MSRVLNHSGTESKEKAHQEYTCRFLGLFCMCVFFFNISPWLCVYDSMLLFCDCWSVHQQRWKLRDTDCVIETLQRLHFTPLFSPGVQGTAPQRPAPDTHTHMHVLQTHLYSSKIHLITTDAINLEVKLEEMKQQSMKEFPKIPLMQWNTGLPINHVKSCCWIQGNRSCVRGNF